MSLHKLTAGDGYTYLTKQVAAHDDTDRGYDNLADYYAQRGESPGLWMGRGLAGLSGFPAGLLPAGFGPTAAGDVVTEAQMLALFGHGRHPDAGRLATHLAAAGHSPKQIKAITGLGTEFVVHQGATMFRRRVAGAFEQYNRTVGAPKGTAVPADERARIRTSISETMFVEENGRAPLDDRERSGFMARISRQATKAVAGYDLTFSPVKSVSVLWAIAPAAVSQQIEAAHRAAVTDTIRWLEDAATYTRRGRGGVRQVDVTGLIAAAFEHRDSRAGDPDLHTHVAISNKVQAVQDLHWLALDGRPLHAMTVAASERYNTRLEAHLIDRLGVAFEERTAPEPGKRPVRELVGVVPELMTAWSRRRAAIDQRRVQLAAAFQAEHGRPPTAIEAIHLAQQANLETRQAKHEPRSLGEQRTTWCEQAIHVLGGQEQLAAMLARVLPNHQPRKHNRLVPAAIGSPNRRWVNQTAYEVIAVIQERRATWQEAHVRAEAERQARAAAIPLAFLDQSVDDVVAMALSPPLSINLDRSPTTHTLSGRNAALPCSSEPEEPLPLRRADGSSAYITVGSLRFTSQAIVDAEHQLLASAAHRDGPVLSERHVDVALLESTANGLELNPGQAQLVHDLARSGARLQLALAPAGTGKTTAIGVLAKAWNSAGGNVLGLAPSAVAAAVLREGLPGAHTDTLAKLIHEIGFNEGRSAAGRHPTAWLRPKWVTDIGPSTLVVIDEAGMAGTVELASAVDFLTEAGASVRLIGDDQQLAAVAAGGILRDIAIENGAATLDQVLRFEDPAEGPASLALRTGDVAAVGYYLDNHRIHVGDSGTAADQAYESWRADIAAGLDSVLLAPTREVVAELNARAQADRLRVVHNHLGPQTQGEAPLGGQIALADGLSVSAGDTIITRRNSRRLRLTATDWVKNGYRWYVEAVTENGALHVRHHGSGLRIQLPAGYVGEHVVLGYAATIHGAQGMTADTCHTVATGLESRQLLYVAMTRARHGNHLYLTVVGDGEEHTAITRDALLPPTAADLLTRILDRDGAQISARSTRRQLDDPVTRLQTAAARYQDAVLVGAEHALGQTTLAALDELGERSLSGLAEAPAWPTLRSHLALLALDGTDPAAALAVAIGQRELDTAEDPAAVIDWRLAPTGRDASAGPLPWLPPIPQALKDDDTWGPYLRARAELTQQLAAAVRGTAQAWTPASAPRWARLLAADPAANDLIGDLAIWRATHSVADTDTAPTGPRPAYAAEDRYHRTLRRRTADILGAPNTAVARWRRHIAATAPDVLDDALWPWLAARLDTAARTGADVAAALRYVTAGSADTASDGSSWPGGLTWHGPLPDEHVASALWWRLVRYLSPTSTLSPDARPEPPPPTWLEVLPLVLGSKGAQRILNDAAWPALVAAVDDAVVREWSPLQILSVAFEQVRLRGEDAHAAHAEEVKTRDFVRDDEVAAEPNGPRPVQLVPALVEHIRHLVATWPSVHADPEPRGLQAPPLEDEPPNLSAEQDETPPNPPRLPIRPKRGQPVRTPQQAAPASEPPASAAPAALPQAAPERIAELNAMALTYYADRLAASWVPAYLDKRLGPEVAGQLTSPPDQGSLARTGYAPAGWTNLVTHLRRAGVSDVELLLSGLATRTSTGKLIDRFRDRLVFPILSTTDAELQILGFVGRRNPRRDALAAGDGLAQSAGPKYLNTSSTNLFDKSSVLYGLSEARTSLTEGATPVLVEGPLDAIAITFGSVLAGSPSAPGIQFVGVSALGTALTEEHVRLLGRTSIAGKVLVATDADPAGETAARRAFWMLAAHHGGDVNRVVLPLGDDPAQLLQREGPQTLRAALVDAGDLSQQIVDARIDFCRDDLGSLEGRVRALRLALEVVATQDSARWSDAVGKLAERLDLMPETVQRELFLAWTAWIVDPQDVAGQMNRRDHQLVLANSPRSLSASNDRRREDRARADESPTGSRSSGLSGLNANGPIRHRRTGGPATRPRSPLPNSPAPPAPASRSPRP